MYITSSGPEGSPRIDFSTQTGSWYNLKSVVDGTKVKIYVNNRLVKEITMSGKEANSKTNNYVGIWCHSMDPIAGDSFKGKIKKEKYSKKKKKKRTPGGGLVRGEGLEHKQHGSEVSVACQTKFFHNYHRQYYNNRIEIE